MHRRIVAAIGTRYDRSNKQIEALIPRSVMHYSRLQRRDGGDLFRVASAVQRTAGGGRDNSYIRVSMT